MRVGTRSAAQAAAAALLGLVLTACVNQRTESTQPGSTPGAASVTIETPDGLALAVRLWSGDAERLVIYLHGYRQDQSSWWPLAAATLPQQPSVLTFDFRGHGRSPGRANDLDGTQVDVAAAIAFARARGYRRIVLVGAGMGAAAGMLAAANDDAIALVGISAPDEFGDLHPLAVASRFAGRLVLVASKGDLSAARSLTQFQAAAAVPIDRIALVSGAVHGTGLLVQATGPVLAFYEQALAALWAAPRLTTARVN